jgi:GxxExxY protein
MSDACVTDAPSGAHPSGAPLTPRIIGLAIRVHRHLGPGLLESVYETCLCHELVHDGLAVVRQAVLPLTYDGVHLETGFRANIIVEHAVILEIKAVKKIIPLHESQMLTYLRLSGFRVGLLMNFNSVTLKDGLRRFVR